MSSASDEWWDSPKQIPAYIICVLCICKESTTRCPISQSLWTLSYVRKGSIVRSEISEQASLFRAVWLCRIQDRCMDSRALAEAGSSTPVPTYAFVSWALVRSSQPLTISVTSDSDSTHWLLLCLLLDTGQMAVSSFPGLWGEPNEVILTNCLGLEVVHGKYL